MNRYYHKQRRVRTKRFIKLFELQACKAIFAGCELTLEEQLEKIRAPIKITSLSDWANTPIHLPGEIREMNIECKFSYESTPYLKNITELLKPDSTVQELVLKHNPPSQLVLYRTKEEADKITDRIFNFAVNSTGLQDRMMVEKLTAEEYCKKHNLSSDGVSWKFLDNSDVTLTDECPNDYITKEINPQFYKKVIDYCGSEVGTHGKEHCKNCWLLVVEKKWE